MTKTDALLVIEQRQSCSKSESLRSFSDVAQAENKSAMYFYELAVNSYKAGQTDTAIRAYQEAIRLDPKFDSAYINLGLAFIQLRQFENASHTFEKVLELPDRAENPASIHTIAHYNLAVILNRQGKLDEAIAEVQKALAITPNFDVARRLLQQLKQSNTQ